MSDISFETTGVCLDIAIANLTFVRHATELFKMAKTKEDFIQITEKMLEEIEFGIIQIEMLTGENNG